MRISERRIQKLCVEGRIEGVVKFSKVWAIPKDAGKPDFWKFKVTLRFD